MDGGRRFPCIVDRRHFTGITHLLTLRSVYEASFQNEGSPISLAPNVGSAQVFALFSTFAAYAGYCAKVGTAFFEKQKIIATNELEM